jgi:hypothetical protein
MTDNAAKQPELTSVPADLLAKLSRTNNPLTEFQGAGLALVFLLGARQMGHEAIEQYCRRHLREQYGIRLVVSELPSTQKVLAEWAPPKKAKKARSRKADHAAANLEEGS